MHSIIMLFLPEAHLTLCRTVVNVSIYDGYSDGIDSPRAFTGT